MTATERGGAKWDRAARYLLIVAQLQAHPDGISAVDIAERIGVSRRTVYRDLESMSMRRGPAHLAGQGPLGPRAATRSCRRWRSPATRR